MIRAVQCPLLGVKRTLIGGAALFHLWPRIMALAAAVVAEAVEAAGALV